MDPAEAMRRIDALLQPRPAGLALETDDDGGVLLLLRRDMLHLDADALHDRLHHWALHELDPAFPAASALVSFRHANPADPLEESTLDAQEGWLDLEPTFRLDAQRVTSDELPRFVALVPTFLRLVEASGRPQGFRRHDVGTIE